MVAVDDEPVGAASLSDLESVACIFGTARDVINPSDAELFRSKQSINRRSRLSERENYFATHMPPTLSQRKATHGMPRAHFQAGIRPNH
jgi:hypothetical protein